MRATERVTVAVAESCTGGLLAAEIVAAPGSGEWFRGGVVAYHSSVKHDLLGVPAGPVISAEAAMAMAIGVSELLGADVGIATTGVAGPESEEGQPVGSVYVGISTPGGSHALALSLDGSPPEVKAEVVRRALQELATIRGGR